MILHKKKQKQNKIEIFYEKLEKKKDEEKKDNFKK